MTAAPKQFKYVEAFCLMDYVSVKTGEVRERIWNSRDGVTPLIIHDRETGEELHCAGVRFAPDHVPQVGDRVFVDLTEQRARVFAAARIERIEASDDENRMGLYAHFETREAAVEDFTKALLTPGAPDLLVVTAGWLEQLEAERANWSGGPSSGDLDTTELRGGETPWPEGERSLCYDRQGRPITAEQFSELYKKPEYKIVARTQIQGDVFVSTVWLGIDHAFGGGPPVIFETMTFEDNTERGGSKFVEFGSDDERLSNRYCTEAEALAGHQRAVAAARELLAEQSSSEPGLSQQYLGQIQAMIDAATLWHHAHPNAQVELALGPDNVAIIVALDDDVIDAIAGNAESADLLRAMNAAVDGEATLLMVKAVVQALMRERKAEERN